MPSSVARSSDQQVGRSVAPPVAYKDAGGLRTTAC